MGKTFLRGLKAFCAIVIYLLPSAIFSVLAYFTYTPLLSLLFIVVLLAAIISFIFAIFSLPGGMTYNAAFNDVSYLYRPDKAFLRAAQAGRFYLKAWLIGLSAILLSFLGLLALGIGFFFTSVWAWMVVGYAFSKALSLRESVP
ncbi:MAG TPA: hypothetical protein DF383_12075 [Deltaproteobacteria bacterium]|nr:hypothetical protein [Deltaproteobacteria bacterium]